MTAGWTGFGRVWSRVIFDILLWHKSVDFSSTQQYNCVMIPELVDIKSVWKVLPPGIHVATLEEVEERFAYNDRRRELFQGLRRGVESLERAGCKSIFLDGSYVTEKENPGDFDACWSPHGIEELELDPVFLNFDDARRMQKDKFGGEFFPSTFLADDTFTYLDYFQKDRDRGKEKGILCIGLS